MVRLLAAFVMGGCFTVVAMADIAPPPPERGFKRVPHKHLMKLDAELPGYRFFTFQRLGLGGKETIGEELKLRTDEGIAVPSSSSPSVRTGVVAVPETVWTGLRTTENVATLLTRNNQAKLPEGMVVYETRGTSQDLRDSDPRTTVVSIITVSHDATAGVKFTVQHPSEVFDPAHPNAPHEPTRQAPWVFVIVGVATTLALITLGIWYWRRK
jgi:hypothetical protein